ncbi:MAG TPA: FlgD immunoglobulin-like domain containing protein [Mycobacteriales bacterium]|jgi:hypothetical protein|nr:FlgD immunoglobulin-like domain containing protein [Mycobacteriales bacterium]
MPAFRRLAALPAALLIAAGLGAVPATAGPGAVVIDAHDSFVPTAAYEISSSTGGTVYSADVGGFGRLYLAPAAMAVGSSTVDLGPRPYRRMGATIAGSRVAFPSAPTFDASLYAGPVTAVRSCSIGTCPTVSTMTTPAGYQYIGNADNAAIVWNPTTDKIGVTGWTGSPSTLTAVWDAPLHYEEPPTAVGDANGIVVSGQGEVTYVNRGTSTVTSLGDGDDGVLTPTYVAWHLDGTGPSFETTEVRRVLRSSPGSTPSVQASLTNTFIEDLAANDSGVAWTVPNEDGDGSVSLWTMAWDTTPALYARPLVASGLSTLEATGQFVVNDRRAGTPGFYKVTPGSLSGTLTGLVPVRPSNTRALAISAGRAVYTDDTTADIPAFARSVANGNVPGSLGPESSLASAADGSVGISGPYVAYSTSGATAGTTDVHYGRLGTTLAVRTYPENEVGKVAVSGHRVLVSGGVRSRVIDILAGTVTDLGHVFAAIFGEYVATINYDTGLVQRRNLLTGGTQTVLAATCTSSCVDDDGWHLSMWGAEVVYAFWHGGTGAGFVSGLFNGATGATTALPMLLHAGDPDVWDLAYWDGLLLVAHPHDVSVHLYDTRVSPAPDALVDSFAEGPLALDGVVAGWRPDADLRAVVRDLHDFFPSFSAEPRYLGGRLPAGFGPGAPTATWQPSFLLSNDMTGTLDLHSGSATGPVVRSIPVNSQYGEVTATWDGKDTSATQLPQGTYYWTLTRAAAAPTPVKNAAGSAIASGSVFLSVTGLGAPAVTAPALSTNTSATPAFTVSWSLASAPAGTRFNVLRSTNNGAYATWLSATSATSASMTGTIGATYRFKVQSVDPSGRAGGTSAVASTLVPYDDGSAAYSSGWGTASNASLYRGSHHYSSTAGATLSITAPGTAIYLVGLKAASYGQFQVSIDGGAWSGLIDSYRSGTAFRQVLFSRTGLANANHTLRVRVYGTSGRPTVGVDAVGFLR